jgi:hypothetical protein
MPINAGLSGEKSVEKPDAGAGVATANNAMKLG